MTKCKSCGEEIKDGCLLECPNCKATLCSDCGQKTQGICPYCYYDLEVGG